jgi:GT2 family glycosyltransferase
MTAREMYSARAGAGMYRRVAFEWVGYFDDDFFAYFEDVDWSFRAPLRRFRCWPETLRSVRLV